MVKEFGRDGLTELWLPKEKVPGEETEAEARAAMERWTSLPAEEKRRLLSEYSMERMRQERLGCIP